MKVSFAINDGHHEISGVTSWLRRLLRWLRDAGIDAEAHVAGDGGAPGTHCAWFASHGIPYQWMPATLHTPDMVRGWSRMLEKSQPDIYVPNCMITAYFAAGYARQQGISTIGVLHSADQNCLAILDEFVRGRPGFRLSALVGISKFLTTVAQEAAGGLIPVELIGCGMSVPEHAASPPTDVFRLIYLGRLLEPQKCISKVTHALCSAVKSDAAIEAWVVGEGEARPSVESIIQASGVGSDRIRLWGRVDNDRVPGILRQCHAYVLLSDIEGLPISLLEAMASGVVPICLDLPSGIRDVINSGVNGLIVKDRNEDFLGAVRRLRHEPGTWQKFSSAARTTIEENFSFEAGAEKWYRLLTSLQSGQSLRKPFKAPRVFRLPPPNLKFGTCDQRIPWLRRDPAVRWRMRLGRWRRAGS